MHFYLSAVKYDIVIEKDEVIFKIESKKNIIDFK